MFVYKDTMFKNMICKQSVQFRNGKLRVQEKMLLYEETLLKNMIYKQRREVMCHLSTLTLYTVDDQDIKLFVGVHYKTCIVQDNLDIDPVVFSTIWFRKPKTHPWRGRGRQRVEERCTGCMVIPRSDVHDVHTSGHSRIK